MYAIAYDAAGNYTQSSTVSFTYSALGSHTFCITATDCASNETMVCNTFKIVGLGCSHGYWKKFTAKWPSPYKPSDLVKDRFSSPQFATGQPLAPLAGQTLLSALKYTGTSTSKPLDAARILMVQAIAAVLNQAKYGAAFPYPGDVITAVNAALTKGSDTDAQWKARMLVLKTQLDKANNSLCQ